MAKARRYERADFVSADPAIARFAQYLDLRRMSPRPAVADQRDLESFGSFLNARAAGLDLDAHHAPPYESLESAGTADVLAYLTRLNGSRAYAGRSIRRKISALRTFYKHLKFDGRRTDNPASDVPTPKIGKPLPKALTERDVTRLLAVDLAGLTETQRRRD